MRLLAPVLLVCTLALWPLSADAAAPIVPDDPLPSGATLRLGNARLRHPTSIRSLSLSRDGRTLASADLDGRIRVWNTGDGRLLLADEDAGAIVALSPGGKTLLVGDAPHPRKAPRAVRLFDARTGKVLRTF